MRERDEHVVDGRDVRLGGLPRRGAAARGVARVTHGHEALERCERGLVEHLRHEAQVLRRHDGLAVAHGDAGAFLAAVLQCLQPEAGHAGHVLAGGEHAEHGTLLFRAVGTPTW